MHCFFFLFFCVPQHSIGGSYVGWAWRTQAVQRLKSQTHVATLASGGACCEGEIGLQCEVLGLLQQGCLGQCRLQGDDGAACDQEVRRRVRNEFYVLLAYFPSVDMSTFALYLPRLVMLRAFAPYSHRTCRKVPCLSTARLLRSPLGEWVFFSRDWLFSWVTPTIPHLVLPPGHPTGLCAWWSSSHVWGWTRALEIPRHEGS